MKKLSCIIVDDEPVARKILHEFVDHVPFMDLQGKFENAMKAEAFLKNNTVDMIFLDIEMPKVSGLQLLQKMHIESMVILTTAFPQYALEGYELDIIDYVLKPLSFSRFIKAVAKAGRVLSVEEEVNKPAATREQKDAFLYFKIDKEMIKVQLNDILFIESCKEYVKLYLEAKRPLLVKQSISSLEKLLSPHRFLRVHRSYMVTIERVQSYSATHLKIGDMNIPIGRFYKSNVDQFIKH